MNPTTHLAFLIGVQDYQHLQPLKTPLNDIRDLGHLLQSSYGYTVFDCQNPTMGGLRAFFGQMKSEVQRAAAQLPEGEPLSVLCYFAGHGIAADSETGVKGYLMPTDVQRADAKTWLPMSELLDTLEALSCRHSLVLLDCCFSGSLRWASKHRGISGFVASEEKLYQQHYEHFRSRRSSQVLTSAAPDQLALDFVRGGTATERSPFAECVIRGLQGEADTVPDKVITCAELFTYLQNHLLAVSEKCGNPQNASLFPLDRHDFGEYLFFMDGFDPATLELREYHNPYRGLSAYETKHQFEFFGRSQAIAALLLEVEQHPLTVVLGASGTGKSSLVKAGIVPRLKGRVGIIKPGLTPLAELPDATTYDILVIDQLEQLVTQATEQDAIAFLKRMAELLQNGKKIIATLRIDYESRLPKIPELEGHWHRYLVPPFSAEELREVIVTPTFRQGHFIVPMTLVDRIIEEVIHYPGSLPLLSFTMRQLFERCKDQPFGNITPADYEALGGVIGALQRKADAVHDALPDDAHRNTMRCLMLRMVSLTGGQAAGKRVLLDDLHFADPAENERLKTVRNQLEDERLIVAGTDHSGQGYIEPVHDALVNTWDKVQQWVNEFGIGNVILLSRLTDATNDYIDSPEEGRLWAQTANLRLIKDGDIQSILNKRELDFIQKSQRLEEDRFAESERKRKEAEEARDRAEKNMRAAKNTALTMQSVKTNPTIALRMAEYNLKQHPEYDAAYSIFHDIISDTTQSFYQQTIRSNPAVFFVAFSPDGKTILTGHDDKTAKLWSLDGQLLRTFEGHTGTVKAAVFSPDGRNILTGSGDKTAILWSLDGHVISTFSGHQGVVSSIAFAPDGKTILTGSLDKTAKLWSLDGRLHTTIEGHKNDVNSVAFSPDSKSILTGSSDKTAKLWSLDGSLITTFEGHQGVVTSVAFSPDGKTFLTGSWDWTAKIWSLEGNLITTFDKHKDNVSAVAFSPDGKTILTGSHDWTAKVWSLDGNLLNTLMGHQSTVDSVAFSPDGKTVLTGSVDRTARLWPLMGKLLSTFEVRTGVVTSVAFSPNGKTFLMGNGDKKARLWSIDNKLLVTLDGHQDYVSSVAFSANGKTLLTGSRDKTAKLWSLRGKLLATFEGHQGAVNSVAFSPDCNNVLTGSQDKTAKLWTLDGIVISSMEEHQGAVNSVAFSPDGNSILTGCSYIARLWSLDGKLLCTFEEHKNAVVTVVFSPDGKTVMTGSIDETVKLWSLNGKLLSSFDGDKIGVNSAAFSPGGNIILTGGYDKTAKFWSDDGKLLCTLEGHQDYIYSIAFSPDGKAVLTGSYDKTAKLWMVPQVFLQERVCKFTLEELWEKGVQLEPEDLATINKKENKRQ